MPCHHDEEKRGESCPARGSGAAIQRPPLPPYLVPMIGQGRVALSPCPL